MSYSRKYNLKDNKKLKNFIFNLTQIIKLMKEYKRNSMRKVLTINKQKFGKKKMNSKINFIKDIIKFRIKSKN